jgi:hypothetical protein
MIISICFLTLFIFGIIVLILVSVEERKKAEASTDQTDKDNAAEKGP